MTDMQMQTMFYPPPIVQLHGPFPSPMTSHSSFISTPEQSSPNAFSPEINAQAPMESLPNTNLDPNGDLFPELPLLHPAWPPLLPPPALLHHLVDTFFACCPFANRILHRGRTIASMMYPPDSPEFPLPALLHAICAVASFYTSVIEQPHLPGFNELPPDDFFPTPLRTVKPNASFGESHAHLSTLSASKAIQSGQRMLQVMQSTLILSWFHYSSGTAVNVWILVGKACRISGPLGITIADAYGPLSRYNRMPTLIPPPKDHIDAEQRRNLFWLIYISERFHMSGTCWPMLLDDEDISQYLPVTEDDFNNGRAPPEECRQRLASPNVLFNHPPELTDSFSLLAKASVLLAKVKVFNIRFKTKYADDPTIDDPRNTSEFQQLDDLIKNFRSHWPKQYKDPIDQEGKVDPILYLACLVPSCATLMLHDPHADLSSPTCPSTIRITEALNSGMDLVYKLLATSFDVMLLDHVTSFCWTILGATLIRFLAIRIKTESYAEAIAVKSQLDVIRLMLFRLGERTVIGRRQIKLLNEHFEVECRSGMSDQLDTFCAMTTSGGTLNIPKNKPLPSGLPQLPPNIAPSIPSYIGNPGWLLGQSELVTPRHWENLVKDIRSGAALFHFVASRQNMAFDPHASISTIKVDASVEMDDMIVSERSV
ncbi:hypothetical protein FRC02_001482 [Tulasnella sp. 418]|nr:hypothetical protein FRC02_001482 [Tulasnella sp. 418]